MGGITSDSMSVLRGQNIPMLGSVCLVVPTRLSCGLRATLQEHVGSGVQGRSYSEAFHLWHSSNSTFLLP